MKFQVLKNAFVRFGAPSVRIYFGNTSTNDGAII